MSKHPLNLTLRFLLELAALYAVGQWAWGLSNNPVQSWLLLIFSLGIFMALWGIFNVPDDPSRSGRAPIPVKGWLRLLLELLLFTAAVLSLVATGDKLWAWLLSGFLVLHYLTSTDRIRWLLEQ